MTLQAKDLRIANYITKSIATIYRVEGVLHDNVFTEGYNIPASEFSGIPLTEEWLLKFGFLKSKMLGYDQHFTYHHSKLINPITAFYNTDFAISLDGCARTVRHVHQLQNIMHALTGTELTIKEGKEWERNHSGTKTEEKDL